jgi:oligosaccharyltransferase complex subunit alpha (ribophorin I)
MLRHWRSVAFFLLGLTLPSLGYSSQSFENTGIVRTLELGGSLVHITTTFNVKVLESGSNLYTIALGQEEKRKTSWIEATVKGQKELLKLEDLGFDSERYVYSKPKHFRTLSISFPVIYIFWA